MFSSALRACSCVTWSFVRSYQCYCSWNTVLSWVRRFFLHLILSIVAPQTYFHPFERPLQDCYLSIRSPASSKLQSWTKVLGHYCVSGAFSNSLRSSPSPHPTNNVRRVSPDFCICEEPVVAYGRWSLTRVELQRVFYKKKSSHTYFFGENVLYGIFRLQ